MSSREIDKEKPYRCRKCGSSEFRTYPTSGYRYCPPCDRISKRAWYHNNRPRVAAYRSKQKTSPHAREYRRKWRLRQRYGLTQEQFSEMSKAQADSCAICGKSLSLCVDHCHATGRIRGLLCNSCNVGLANFRDDPISLRKAAEYLEGAVTNADTKSWIGFSGEANERCTGHCDED